MPGGCVKVIEESPSPALTPALRERMGAAAVAAARTAGYRNAGTIEFLLDDQRGRGDEARFYFLEMNTRLQVEHPVTESVTGTDLVRAQLHVADGGVLPWSQADLTQRGHAIECRVYAEDPAQGFLPQAGPLLVYEEPSGPGIRIDSGVEAGTDVPVQYDPMLAKLIASGESRDAAIARAVAALRSFPILGVRTNVAFLINVLRHPAFVAGDVHTGFIDAYLDELLRTPDPSAAVMAAAAFARENGVPSPGLAQTASTDPWSDLRGWGR
jgi:acetyl/propionyl-CoA carboxylase alpha subunit